MSIIFGMRKSDGDLVEERHLLDLAQATERWSPDGILYVRRAASGWHSSPTTLINALTSKLSLK
jgi:hypothetical protein